MPPKWTDVYPQGTKEGDEEQLFFTVLARHPKYEWLTTAMIARESKLHIERVEEILEKYFNLGIIFNNPENEDQWGYWEKVPKMVKEKLSLVEEDRKLRIQKLLNNNKSY